MLLFLLCLYLADIVNLLQWRKLEQNEVLGALESLLKVSPEEVVKVRSYLFLNGMFQ